MSVSSKRLLVAMNLIVIAMIHSPECSARQSARVSICDVLAKPNAFSQQAVTISGAVYIGMERTNISDPECAGHAISIRINDHVARRRDVRDFRKKLVSWGMRGYATVTGVITVKDDWKEPYVLDLTGVTSVVQYGSSK